MQCREIIKISELSKKYAEQVYADKVRRVYDRIEHQEIKSVEDE